MAATTHTPVPSTGANVRLWIAQSLLAAMFLFAGLGKLLTPAATLEAQAHMSAEFLYFIGVCETLGALGLVLPGIFGRHRELTSAAAAGLVIIMTGAVTITIATVGVLPATFPLLLGVLATYVARGRRTWIARRRGIGAAMPTRLAR